MVDLATSAPESRPRLLVNALSATVGGGRTHACAQLSALDGQSVFRMTILSQPELVADLRRLCPKAEIRELRVRGLARRLLWEQIVLPFWARGHDIVYMPGNF